MQEFQYFAQNTAIILLYERKSNKLISIGQFKKTYIKLIFILLVSTSSKHELTPACVACVGTSTFYKSMFSNFLNGKLRSILSDFLSWK